jgi:hypothetical protein
MNPDYSLRKRTKIRGTLTEVIPRIYERGPSFGGNRMHPHRIAWLIRAMASFIYGQRLSRYRVSPDKSFLRSRRGEIPTWVRLRLAANCERLDSDDAGATGAFASPNSPDAALILGKVIQLLDLADRNHDQGRYRLLGGAN